MPSHYIAKRRILQAPVHEHRAWRHLQRAAVAAHKQLGNVPQADFCALFVPAASIAVWILQHAPHLAQSECLHILVAHAADYQSLDSGRWLRFIPWLLGRPQMQLELSLVGSFGHPGSVALHWGDPVKTESESEALRARLDHRLQSRHRAAVKSMAPADLHTGSLRSWSEIGHDALVLGGPRLPDLCAVFAPLLSMNYPTLVSEDELLPLLRGGVPLALFSASEAEQLIDVYVLAAAGIHLTDSECWPNPWALPNPAESQRKGAFAKMAWSASSDDVAFDAFPNQGLVTELGDVVAYIDSRAETARCGPDAVLTLGETLRAAATSRSGSKSKRAEVSVLLRLPHGTAVDRASGHFYQIQDSLALLLDVTAVPTAILCAFPGDEQLLLRAIWATSVHRRYVRPFVHHVDATLASQFSALNEMPPFERAEQQRTRVEHC